MEPDFWVDKYGVWSDTQDVFQFYVGQDKIGKFIALELLSEDSAKRTTTDNKRNALRFSFYYSGISKSLYETTHTAISVDDLLNDVKSSIYECVITNTIMSDAVHTFDYDFTGRRFVRVVNPNWWNN